MRTRAALQLPAACTRRVEAGWQTIPTSAAGVGDILLLRAGDVIPADGEIVSGSGAVDEAAFTGENLPRSLAQGDAVTAGTVLREGGAEMRVTADAARSRLAQMLSLLARAGDEKPALAKLADRVAARFVAAVLLVASGVAVYWGLSAPDRALWISLSVLVVSCPCALALATPTALTAAAARLRRRGLLMPGENTLETLLRCDRVIFDKTGTLTEGRFQRRAVLTAPGQHEHTVLAIAAALEMHANHPIASAFDDVEAEPGLDAVELVPGLGIRGRLSGDAVAIGNPRLVRQTCADLGEPPADDNHWIALASSSGPLAWIALEDRPRRDAAHGPEDHADAPAVGRHDHPVAARVGDEALPPWRADSASPRSATASRPRRSSTMCAACSIGDTAWSWSATASTMRRCWPRRIAPSRSTRPLTWPSPAPTPFSFPPRSHRWSTPSKWPRVPGP